MDNMSLESLFSIKGKTALITGGSVGIGLMIAEAYVKNGVKVYVASRKAEVCDEVAADLSQYGECISLPGDVGSEEGVIKLANELKEREDSLPILVNNAGVAWSASFETHDEKVWERVLSLNVKGVFHLTRELLPLLKKAASPEDPARVINMGSIDALHVPHLQTYSYAASKAALHHLTEVIAKELAADQILVNAVAPGFFPTRMTGPVIDKIGDKMVARCPLGRLGIPEDMAGIAIYLASKAGAYVNGEIIRVDGGTIL